MYLKPHFHKTLVYFINCIKSCALKIIFFLVISFFWKHNRRSTESRVKAHFLGGFFYEKVTRIPAADYDIIRLILYLFGQKIDFWSTLTPFLGPPVTIFFEIQ